MNKIKIIGLFFLLVCFVVGYVWFKTRSNIQGASPVHPLVFFEEKTFYQDIESAKKNYKALENQIVGGIIPHHLAVGFVMADFYSRLTEQKPSTIILLGPNHYEKGTFKVLTSMFGWQTPFGIVESDKTSIRLLLEKDLARIDENTVPGDHSVAGSMSYIKYFLPEAKVVPLLISKSLTETESEKLASALKVLVNKDTVIVAPVDFSHYLTSGEAKRNDEKTLQTMKSFDYEHLYLMNNDYLDSPPSIGVLLMVMQKLGKTNLTIFYHSNSGEIQKNESVPTTSYFSIGFN